jgi:hypothetical protein
MKLAFPLPDELSFAVTLAPLPFPLPALLKLWWYIKRGERVRLRGHVPFYATLEFIQMVTDYVPSIGRH